MCHPDVLVVQVDERYHLTGDILDGQMDLDILSVRRTDSGPYCCRVDVDGLFNDKKMIMNLRVVKGGLNCRTTQTDRKCTLVCRSREQLKKLVYWHLNVRNPKPTTEAWQRSGLRIWNCPAEAKTSTWLWWDAKKTDTKSNPFTWLPFFFRKDLGVSVFQLQPTVFLAWQRQQLWPQKGSLRWPPPLSRQQQVSSYTTQSWLDGTGSEEGPQLSGWLVLRGVLCPCSELEEPAVLWTGPSEEELHLVAFWHCNSKTSIPTWLKLTSTELS